MLERLLLLRGPVAGTCLKNELTIFPREWDLIEEIVDVLAPIKLTTERLSASQYPTMSMAYPSYRFLIDIALADGDTTTTAILQLKKTIRQSLIDHMKTETQETLMQLCAYIDPRFKHLSYLAIDERSKVKKVVKECASEIRNDTETEVTFNPHPGKRGRSDEDDDENEGEESLSASKKWARAFSDYCEKPTPVKVQKGRKKDKIVTEMDNYQDEDTEDVTDPLKWWKVNGGKYPILSLLAEKYLGVPATSVPCERLFSIAGQVITKQRCRLHPSTAEMYVFMKAYYQQTD